MSKNLPLGPVILDVAGLELEPTEREILAHPQVGGVILFSRNFESPEQLLALTEQLRLARSDLIIAVDHEGGRVQRFRQGFTHIPSMFSLASAEPALLKPTAQLMALELMVVGVDFTFAPVLDRFNPDSKVIGDRAFAEEPERIVELAAQFIAGLAKEGMAPVGKHFPGHGGVSEDTHIEGAVDMRPWPNILATDLWPFVKLAPQLAGMMPAHVSFPEVCAQPVGFSSYWLREVLRKQMQFSGVIFSDDLSMAAAKALGDPLARGDAALRAGCDVVLLCNEPDEAVSLIEGLERAGGYTSPSDRLLSMSARARRAQQGFSWSALRKTDFWQATHRQLNMFLECGH